MDVDGGSDDGVGSGGGFNLKNGLLVHYPFEGDATDESGNGNHGTAKLPVL